MTQNKNSQYEHSISFKVSSSKSKKYGTWSEKNLNSPFVVCDETLPILKEFVYLVCLFHKR